MSRGRSDPRKRRWTIDIYFSFQQKKFVSVEEVHWRRTKEHRENEMARPWVGRSLVGWRVSKKIVVLAWIGVEMSDGVSVVVCAKVKGDGSVAHGLFFFSHTTRLMPMPSMPQCQCPVHNVQDLTCMHPLFFFTTHASVSFLFSLFFSHLFVLLYFLPLLTIINVVAFLSKYPILFFFQESIPSPLRSR